MIIALKSLANRLGIDRAVAYVLLARLWGAGSGVITLALITSRLNAAEQGTYYTFSNILGLQIFLELGLGFVVMQNASHEIAKLSFSEKGILTGNLSAKARLASLLRKTTIIYTLLSVAFLSTAWPVGFCFFNDKAPKDITWSGPWALLSITAAAAMMTNAMLSFCEGSGQVTRVAKRRLYYSLIGTVITWLILISDGGLYCASGIYSAMVIVGAWGVIATERHWLADLWQTSEEGGSINWRKEIWPFQWRMAISSFSGFFIFQLFNPILYARVSAAEAGRMGLAVQIANLISSIALGWISTKVPQLAACVAHRDWKKMDSIFNAALIKSTVVLCGLFGTAIAILWGLTHALANSPISWIAEVAHHTNSANLPARILSIPGLSALFLCMIFQHLIVSMAFYLRAHKEEPFLLLSVAVAIFTLASVWLAAGSGNSDTVAFAWLLVQGAFAFPAAWIIFSRHRRKWHT